MCFTVAGQNFFTFFFNYLFSHLHIVTHVLSYVDCMVKLHFIYYEGIILGETINNNEMR